MADERHTRSVTARIEPLDGGGWGWSVEWENGGRTLGGSETFPSAVTSVITNLREGQQHIAAENAAIRTEVAPDV